MKSFTDFKKSLKDGSRWMVHNYYFQNLYYAKIVYVKKTFFELEDVKGKRYREYFCGPKSYSFTTNGKTAELFIKGKPFKSYTKVAKKLPIK